MKQTISLALHAIRMNNQWHLFFINFTVIPTSFHSFCFVTHQLLSHHLTLYSSPSRFASCQIANRAPLTRTGSGEMCISGASCEFFLSCWLSGGLLEGPCDGLLRGCCQRGAAKAGKSAGQAIGTLEAPPESPKVQSGLLDTFSKWCRTPALALG